jgi:hypothetical protein
MHLNHSRTPVVCVFTIFAVCCLPLHAQGPDKKAPDPKARIQDDFPVKMEAVADKRGADGKQRIVVTLTLEKDFYAYANPPGDDELVPAQKTLEVAGKNPPKKVTITYPKGEEMKLGPLTLRIYTAKVQLEVVVERAAGDTEPLLVTVTVRPFNRITLMCRWLPTALKKSVE